MFIFYFAYMFCAFVAMLIIQDYFIRNPQKMQKICKKNAGKELKNVWIAYLVFFLTWPIFLIFVGLIHLKPSILETNIEKMRKKFDGQYQKLQKKNPKNKNKET